MFGKKFNYYTEDIKDYYGWNGANYFKREVDSLGNYIGQPIKISFEEWKAAVWKK